MGKSRHIATEKQTFDEILESIPAQRAWAKAIFSRIKHIATIPDQSIVLDIGAASGGFLLACSELGYLPEGIEPSEEARTNAIRLSMHFCVPLHIRNARAESLPYGDLFFDVVHASSVIEHVRDIKQVFRETFRVLKAGGVFWFNSASALCPWQTEIRGFPFFGWYPAPLKRKIMDWVPTNRPQAIGYTATPAINWLTPSKVHSLLHDSGFEKIYDRWDLRLEEEGNWLYSRLLRIIRSTKVTKYIADIVIPGDSYAAIKGGQGNPSKSTGNI